MRFCLCLCANTKLTTLNDPMRSYGFPFEPVAFNGTKTILSLLLLIFLLFGLRFKLPGANSSVTIMGPSEQATNGHTREKKIEKKTSQLIYK